MVDIRTAVLHTGVMTVRIGATLEDRTYKGAIKVAQEEKRSLSNLIEVAVATYVAQHELDAYHSRKSEEAS